MGFSSSLQITCPLIRNHRDYGLTRIIVHRVGRRYRLFGYLLGKVVSLIAPGDLFIWPQL